MSTRLLPPQSPVMQARILRVAEKVMTRDNFAKLQKRVHAMLRDHTRVQPLLFYRQQLAKFVERGESFRTMRGVLSRLYKYDPSPKFQGQLVELAFLHGSTADVLEVLKFLITEDKDFYTHISSKIRARIVPILWKKKNTLLDETLLKHKTTTALVAIERLSVFHLLCRLRVSSELLVYFEQYQNEIVSAAKSQQLDCDEMFLVLGKAALQIGFIDGCRQFLGRIDQKSAAYRTALRVLLIPPAKNSLNTVRKRLLAEKKWENRLILLDQYLATAAHRNPLTDRDRPALNAVLENVLALLPKTSFAWMELSQVLVKHRALVVSYPNLYRVFHEHKHRFCGAGLDSALWHGFLNCAQDDTQHIFFHGIAHLHHYVSCGSVNEKSLWKAKTIVEEHGEEFDTSWQDLHRETIVFVREAHTIPLTQRRAMLKQLLVACPRGDLLLTDIRAYLLACASRYVLRVLEGTVRQKKDSALELDIIRGKANLAHLQNDDLARIWHLSAHGGDYDSAWRIASVLNARRALHPAVRSVWQASGEKRSEYRLWAIDDGAVNACVLGFTAAEQKFLRSFFKIGALVPSLFARLDQKTKVYRRPRHKDRKGNRQRIVACLDKIGDLAPTRKTYYFSTDGILSRNQQVPIFIKNMPSTAWAQVYAQLVERLALNLWAWRLSALVALIDKVLPKFITRSRITAKAMMWFRNLSPEQRNAWHSFMDSARHISDLRAEELLGAYLCRLATCIYQNHYQALLSLQLMRVPVTFIWELEKFVVSAEYRHLRDRLRCLHRVAPPRSVLQLESVLTK